THPPVPRDVLVRWYGRLPDADRRRPGGRLLGAVAAGDADPAAAVRELDAAATGFRERAEATGELACLVQLGQLAWWSEDRAQLVALVARVFELERSGVEPAVPLACLGRALVADVQNDSRAVLAELDRIPPGSLNDHWQAIVSWLRSTSTLHLGDARTALAAADAAVARAGDLHRRLAEGARLQARWFLGEVDAVAAALPALVERTFASGPRNYSALTASQCALAHALLGHPAPAAEHLARARGAAGTPPAPLVESHLAIASAALAIATGDDDRGALLLAEHLTRQPLSTGHSAAPQQRSLALMYVLLPSTRPVWDATGLGPAFSVARDLARAVAGLHDGDGLPPDVPPLPDSGVVRAHLPRRWAVELATALADVARQDGWRLLEDLWPEARPDVVALAEHGARPVRTAARAALARLAVPPSAHLELRLLGTPELCGDGVPVTAPEWRRERVRSLLAYLVLRGGAGRGEAADDLWPTLDAEAQSRNLRVTLTYLLRVLEPDRTPRGPSFFVRQEGNRLRLQAGGHLDVDVWAFDALADRAFEADRNGSPSAALDAALAAVELWRADPTELASEPWALPLVERRRLRVAALATRAGELLLAKGAVDGARALAERALVVDAWSEAAHRVVVLAHRAGGDDLGARRALGRFREMLDDLGVTPDDATLMVERLLDDRPTTGRLAGG
ncbi:MAG TPA: BTAD domain-containing putative transcriptional regulator, partial [Acidimicrobiales bacterium]|nr:BTAD domain-containing putative transcriptional regulator [Acidimicrobiales bacterium]